MREIWELFSGGNVYAALIPVYVILLVVERAAYRKRAAQPWDDKDAASNILITVAFLAWDTIGAALVPLGLFVLIGDNLALFTLPTNAAGIAVTFAMYDLIWYVDHRIAHRTGLFWSMHRIHHSSNQYNITVSSRGSLLDATLLSRPLFFLMPVFGVTLELFLIVKIFTNVWGIFQHSQTIRRMGPLEEAFATPSNHRVHHGSDAKYLDKNYGEVTIFWDRLFRSYQPEEEAPTYGLTTPATTYNPWKIQTDGFVELAAKMRRCETRGEKLQALWKPPSWQPPGQRPPVPQPDAEQTVLLARVDGGE